MPSGRMSDEQMSSLAELLNQAGVQLPDLPTFGNQAAATAPTTGGSGGGTKVKGLEDLLERTLAGGGVPLVTTPEQLAGTAGFAPSGPKHIFTGGLPFKLGSGPSDVANAMTLLGRLLQVPGIQDRLGSILGGGSPGGTPSG